MQKAIPSIPRQLLKQMNLWLDWPGRGIEPRPIKPDIAHHTHTYALSNSIALSGAEWSLGEDSVNLKISVTTLKNMVRTKWSPTWIRTVGASYMDSNCRRQVGASYHCATRTIAEYSTMYGVSAKSWTSAVAVKEATGFRMMERFVRWVWVPPFHEKRWHGLDTECMAHPQRLR